MLPPNQARKKPEFIYHLAGLGIKLRLRAFAFICLLDDLPSWKLHNFPGPNFLGSFSAASTIWDDFCSVLLFLPVYAATLSQVLPTEACGNFPHPCPPMRPASLFLPFAAALSSGSNALLIATLR